jgi:intracellular sulfur oxidation DsrE/DsrF family protein
MTSLARIARPLLTFVIALAALGGALPALAEKIVLQVSDGNVATWNQALNVVGNLREAYGPGTQIEVVAFGQGINMLKMDAPVSSRLADAQKRDGATLYACENSMTRQKLSRGDMSPDVVYVKAGVEHMITRSREGWVVIRP